MSTPAQALEVAGSQVGVAERPRGSNRTPYGDWFGFNGVAWCSIFVAWVLARIGLDPRPAIDGYASCASALAGWRRLGRTVAKDQAQPGDVLFFKIGRRGNNPNHTGLARSAPYRQRGRWVIDTIEGNTNAGGSRTGGQVLRKTRPMGQVVGVARPQYLHQIPPPVVAADEAARLAFWFAGEFDRTAPVARPSVFPVLHEGTVGDWVKVWQGAFDWAAGESDPIDGEFGPSTADTVRRVQRLAGLPASGSIDVAAWGALRFCVHAKAAA